MTRNFPPLVGGMERLALETVRALSAAAAVALIGPKGCVHPGSGPAHGVCYRSAICFLVDSWRVSRRLAAAEDYQWVIGGSGLAAPAVRAAARIAGASSACFVHGLDLVASSPGYRSLCLPALRRLDLVLANSRNTARLATEAGVAAARIKVVHPGVAIAEAVSPDLFLSRFPLARGRRLLVSVGRLLPRKGVAEFVLRALPRIVARHPAALLVIAGATPRNALLRQADEQRRLGDVIARLGLTEHCLVTGELPEQLLQSLYAAGTLAVFPVRDLPGDVEGFGMVALEAAAQGVPTVAFAAGGVSDAVADGTSGVLIAPGDYARMAEFIERFLGGDRGSLTAASCRGFAAGFAWPHYGDRLRQLFLAGPDGAGGYHA